MTKSEALARLRAGETELRAIGVDRLSVFGSTARDEATASSDVDIAVRLSDHARVGLLQLAVIAHRLEGMVGGRIDLVCEPAAKARVQAGIDRDRVHVF